MKKEKFKEVFLIGVISGVFSAITLVVMFFTYVEMKELYDEYKSSTNYKEGDLKGIVCKFPSVPNDSIEMVDTIH